MTISDEKTALQSDLADVAIFPLPGCIFFPNTLLPLNIFEPRYVAMIEDALAGSKLIVMIDCDKDESISDVGGVGRILHHERTPDGRFHIYVQGVARARVLSEHDRGAHLYRRVNAEILDDEDENPEDVQAAVMSMRTCFYQLRTMMRDSPLSDLPSHLQDPSVMSDVICAATLADLDVRRRALAESSVRKRLSMATEAMADMLLRAAPNDGGVH